METGREVAISYTISRDVARTASRWPAWRAAGGRAVRPGMARPGGEGDHGLAAPGSGEQGRLPHATTLLTLGVEETLPVLLEIPADQSKMAMNAPDRITCT